LKIKLSYVGPDDIDLLVAHRLNMWRDIHPEFGTEVDESEGPTRKWIKRKLAEGKLIGLIARSPDGKVAGSGCIWLREEQPRPTNPRQEVPYLMSMYTEPTFRRKGVAKAIVKRALGWCREHNYDRVVLHASTQGKPLYESLGFESTTEMRLKF
jgi:GNAT superfamily N-acetyltransferase